MTQALLESHGVHRKEFKKKEPAPRTNALHVKTHVDMVIQNVIGRNTERDWNGGV